MELTFGKHFLCNLALRITGTPQGLSFPNSCSSFSHKADLLHFHFVVITIVLKEHLIIHAVSDPSFNAIGGPCLHPLRSNKVFSWAFLIYRSIMTPTSECVKCANILLQEKLEHSTLFFKIQSVHLSITFRLIFFIEHIWLSPTHNF
jgi:hypothetical protein